MAALGFALFLICMAVTRTIGSESKTWSGTTILDSIKALNQSVLKLENSVSSIPQTIQAATEEMLLYILDKMADNSEALRNECQALLSNHSLRVEKLEDDFTQMKQNLRDQTLLIKKLHPQEDDENSCFEEPPSSQNGRPVDFERKHGSEVRYRCDLNFVQTENSTVRCHFGKWEGQPPVCRFFDTSFLLRADYSAGVSKVTCFSEVSNQKMEFSRDLDTGLNGALPGGANIYSQGKASVLDLTGVNFGEKRGVYNCGYEKDGTRTGISFHIDEDDLFVRRVVASIGDIAELSTSHFEDSSFRWFHDGRHIPSADGRRNLTITGVKATDAGNYERKDQRSFSAFFKLVVRGCPSTLFGEGCDLECPPCYNGGTCHDHLGVCVCPPGFTGTNCELACGVNKFGTNCSESCQGVDCRRQVFCKPYPSGCSCAPGYEGYICQYRCSEGMFGADCKQTCRCAEGTCDPYTGACPGGCSPGWTGQSCQIPA